MARVRGHMMALPLVSLFVTAILSCSSTEDGAAPGTIDGGPIITCESDSRDVYVANLEKPGRAGTWKFVLAESSPAPPARGRNTWTVKLLDASGKPVTGAKIAVTAFMPAHGHSSPTTPIMTPAGDGYSIGPISLFMPGLWEVTVDAEAAGIRDSTVFSFCVAG